MKGLYIFLTVLLGISLFYSCIKKNESDFVEKSISATDTVTYTKNIEAIITSYCVNCHNDNTANGGIRLHNYQEVKKVGQSGLLYEVLVTNDPVKRMPPSGSLPASDVEAVRKWVKQGYIE
jgi:hypothetical protein